MMKLYTVPLAPNPMRVTLYVAEREARGAAFGIESIIVNTLKGRQREPEHLARNRFGTLPVLKLETGEYLTESLSIIDYLEERFPEGRLLGIDPKQRALARNIERTLEMRVTFDLGWYVHYQKSPLGWEPNYQKAKELAERIQPGLDYAESLFADGRQFLTGEQSNTADCTLAAFLQFMRFTETDLLGDRPALRQWDQMYRSQPHLASLFMV